MTKLRIIYRWMRRLLRRRLAGSATHSISSIDPAEFSNLLCSGRNDDLKLLARKLSEQIASSRRGLSGNSGQTGAGSRNSRISK
jgi:hypothetical protein